MSVFSESAAQAAIFMERSGYASGTRASYQRVWDQFEQYSAQIDVPDPNRQTAGQFCAAAGADGSAQWQVFHRRAVSCLFDVTETGRFAFRAGEGRFQYLKSSPRNSKPIAYC